MKLKVFFLLLFPNIWVDSLLIDDLSSLKTCGSKKTEDFEDREYLPPGFNSYSVKLKFNRQQCSGSIIQERTILTAGHCCHEIKDNPTVYFGEFWRRGDPYFDSLRFNVTARKVILHPEYRVLPTQFDACLVFLNDSIYDVMPENCSRSGCVEPVCLPNFPVESFTNYTAISSGFGRKTWMLSKTLDHYSGSILTEEMCLLHENMQKKKLHSGHFCIGNLKTINEKGNLQVDRITFCDGFSGSPLVVNSDGYATIVGILSWGGRCGRYKKKYNPLVFQKVHSILPWIQKHMELESFPIKITASSDVSQNSSAPTEPPKVGAEPTKLPSILNKTLPEEKTLIPSVSTSSITKQTLSSLLPESVTDTGAAFVTSRKHLDSVSLDRQEEENQESVGDVSKVVEIPSTSEVTFQTVNLATESTTKPAQSLPEASKSIDTDLVSPEIQNVKWEKLSAAAEEVHEILNKTNSSPKEEFTEVDADKSNFHLPSEFISASNSDLSEAIEGPFEPETNITMLVDNMNGNENINAHFLTSDSSHTPALIEDLPSDSQSINLSGKRDQSANMGEILLPNFDNENDYTQVIDGAGFFEIPPIVDPDSALFNEKSGDYFSYSDFYVDDDSDYWQEKEAETSFEEAPIIFSETDSYLDELGKDTKVKEIPFEISIMQEKDRVPIIAHSSYGSSSNTEVVEPPIEWVYSAAETISSLTTLNSTATTTTTSTTTTTTSPEPKTTSSHISTSTWTTGTPHRTSTAEKNSIKNKHNSREEPVTPKNVAALTQSPVSMDFSSVPAAMSSDAMHSTTSKIIGVDFYQEIVYDTEQGEAGTSELPLVTLFQNGAYVYSSLGIIVLALSMCGCLAVRKQSRQCCSRQDSISKKNSFQETQSSRSSYLINDV
ncbi:Oidioi.mRNA.OKI2018_I69.chr2.g6483.t1.cds [Oikopleura dioica]|uniref:Oidioi.mRNA.OKI2018_I69.chr2.g6483.t1.cds n=1 Tax=Oikopleura dioica TaxID=34765 RepID=A0ABN7T391_OIKDI|nr:Oidioi.mRNA.OKI2018_I69.chr2.g6483.t1.cds [Oikopleura dioica]